MASALLIITSLTLAPCAWAVSLRASPSKSSSWAAHKPGDAARVCQFSDVPGVRPWEQVFSNKHDFAAADALIEGSVVNEEMSNIFVVGTHDGSDIMDLFAKPWYDASKIKIHGFEISSDNIDKADRNMHGQPNAKKRTHPEVFLSRNAVSDSDGDVLHISGHGEVSGIYAANEKYHSSGEDVYSVKWSSVVKDKKIPAVAYAVVDVEGHEVEVIQGMDLEHHKAAFPLFQYELGGTWADSRHSSNMTQGDTAEYLEKLGYRVYLMGQDTKNGRPVLMPTTPATFRESTCMKELHSPRGEKRKGFVQGNALAVLEAAGEQKPWLRNAIDQFVQWETEL